MSGRAGNRNKKVKVWARIRPTSNFAHDNLELLPDHKVILAAKVVSVNFLYQTKIKRDLLFCITIHTTESI